MTHAVSASCSSPRPTGGSSRRWSRAPTTVTCWSSTTALRARGICCPPGWSSGRPARPPHGVLLRPGYGESSPRRAGAWPTAAARHAVRAATVSASTRSSPSAGPAAGRTPWPARRCFPSGAGPARSVGERRAVRSARRRLGRSGRTAWARQRPEFGRRRTGRRTSSKSCWPAPTGPRRSPTKRCSPISSGLMSPVDVAAFAGDLADYHGRGVAARHAARHRRLARRRPRLHVSLGLRR